MATAVPVNLLEVRPKIGRKKKKASCKSVSKSFAYPNMEKEFDVFLRRISKSGEMEEKQMFLPGFDEIIGKVHGRG